MSTTEGTVTVWQSGRLAPSLVQRHPEFTGEHWIGAGLLALAAFVLAMFVMVLEQDVARSELQHATQRSRAVAEAQCEAGQSAEQRGRCIALFNGDELAATGPATNVPANALYEQENAARAMTVSLVSSKR